MKRNNRYLAIMISVCVAALAIWYGHTTTTYYIVRHAEKLRPDADVLSEAGVVRAGVLRDLLLDKGIDTIYHSEKLRSSQTASPLANAQSIQIVVYLTTLHDAFISRLSAVKNKQVLVVSHSNLVPELVLRLANRPMQDIPETDFDNLYIIKVRWLFNIPYSRTHQTYGAPTE